MCFEFNIFIPGKPIPKPRPKSVTGHDGRIKVYTPSNGKEYCDFVAWKVKSKMRVENKELSLKHVRVKMVFYSFGKCDLDNLIKSILDAMNGIIYKDDTQVYKIEAEKIPVKNRENCGVEIYIWEINKE